MSPYDTYSNRNTSEAMYMIENVLKRSRDNSCDRDTLTLNQVT